jgi:hypothetical protein
MSIARPSGAPESLLLGLRAFPVEEMADVVDADYLSPVNPASFWFPGTCVWFFRAASPQHELDRSSFFSCAICTCI